MNLDASSQPRINGTTLAAPQENLTAEELRGRACTELLRQAAITAGLLSCDDPPAEGGVISEAASNAIESLLDRELQLPEPTEEACRRYYAAQSARYAMGERVLARHILFAVAPGVDVVALRKHAEVCLLDLRCRVATATELFGELAARWSNCPSSQQGGELGWLAATDCAPEFARELFGKPDVGVLPRLVHSRFGLHIVEVMQRAPGEVPDFEAVRPAVIQTLRQQSFITALRQYLQMLAGEAQIEGVDLDVADSPLVQ